MRRLPIVICVLALLASACSSPASPEQGAGDRPAAPRAGARQVKPDDLPKVDQSLVTGIRTVATEDFHRRLFTDRISVPGAPALDDSLNTHLDAVLDWYQDKGPDAPPGSSTASPELTVTSTVVGASTEMIGIRMTAFRKDARATEHQYFTSWYRISSQYTVDTAGLFADEKRWTDFHAQVRKDLLQLPAVDRAVLEGKNTNPVIYSVTFNEVGDLVAEIDEGSVAPASAGTFAVTVRVDDPQTMLSEDGRAARDARLKPQRIALDSKGAASVAPEPSPEPQPAAPAPPPGQSTVDCTKVKCVALTFDDGPGPYTAKLLDTLNASKTPATFYVLGKQVERSPGVVRRAVAAGHQIGNHTTNHRQLTALSPEGIKTEVDTTARAIKNAGGRDYSTIRPPYGAHNQSVDAALDAPIILWDVDTLDWKTRNTQATVEAVKRSTRPGSIVLMHDIHSATVEAVPAIVDWLRSQGYQLVTVDQLLAGQNPRPGQVFTRGPHPS